MGETILGGEREDNVLSKEGDDQETVICYRIRSQRRNETYAHLAPRPKSMILWGEGGPGYKPKGRPPWGNAAKSSSVKGQKSRRGLREITRVKEGA